MFKDSVAIFFLKVHIFCLWLYHSLFNQSPCDGCFGDDWNDLIFTKWMQKAWCVHTVEYYSALKKKETLLSAATWMDLEYMMLSCSMGIQLQLHQMSKS